MIILRGFADIGRVSNPAIRSLLALRLQQLGTVDDGLLVVVEAGDVVGDIEQQFGIHILYDPYSDARYGHPEFTQSFDFVIDHSAAYEMHFDASDDGIGTTLLVSKGDGIDADLLALCREFAIVER